MIGVNDLKQKLNSDEMKLFGLALFMSLLYLLAFPQCAHPDNILSCVSKDGIFDESCAETMVSNKQLAMEVFYFELLSELTRHHQKAINNSKKYTPPSIDWYSKRLELLTGTFEEFLRYKQTLSAAVQLEFKFGDKAIFNYYNIQINTIEQYHEILLRIYRPEKTRLMK